MSTESRILDVGDHIQLTLAECGPFLTKWSAPLFAVDTHDKPDLYATCVAVSLKGRVYLLTAAHAIHEIEKTGSAVHVGGQIIKEVPSRFSRTSNDGDDHIDIAAAEVDAEFILQNGMSIVEESQLVTTQQFKSPHLHCMHGFPLTKNKPFKSVNVDQKKVTGRAFTYAGVLVKEPDYQHYKRSEKSHFALLYQLGKNNHGNKVNPPKPKGMSGGGLWIVPDSRKPSACYLGGILIEQHGKTVLATKMNEVIDFISKGA